MIDKKKQRIRKIENRPISLLDEIHSHLVLWCNDYQFNRLHGDTKRIIHDLLDQISIEQTLKDVTEKCGTQVKDMINIEKGKFIAIYKKKYLELTDFDCEEVITSAGIVIIRTLVEKLLQEGSSVQEYIFWFFDEFLQENKKLCPPNIRLATSNSITSKFFYVYKEKLNTRKKDAELAQRRTTLMKLASEVFSETQDTEIGDVIIKFGSNKIPYGKAKEFIGEFIKKLNNVDFNEKFEKLV